MERCETCKHWLPSEQRDVEAGGLRRCGAVREKWDVEDEIPKHLRDGKYGCKGDDDPETTAYIAAAEIAFARALAVVNDGSEFRAELLTRPDFGCVLHALPEVVA